MADGPNVNALAGGPHRTIGADSVDPIIAQPVSDVRLLPGGTLDEDRPRTAALADGGFVMVWTQSGGTPNVFAQRFHANGDLNGAPIDVSAAAGPAETMPEVTALAGGGFAVVYVTALDSSLDVVVYDSSASPTASFTVASGGDDEQSPTIHQLASGHLLITYAEPDGDILAERYTTGGMPAGGFSIAGFAEVGTPAAPFVHAVATLSNGGFAAAWTESGTGNVRVQAFDADAVPLGVTAELAAFAPVLDPHPDIALLSDGPGGAPDRFIVVWAAKATSSATANIYSQLFDLDGTPVGSPIEHTLAIPSSEFEPSVSALPGGGYAITWNGNDGPNNTGDVRVQLFNADGSPRGNAFAVTSTGFTPAPDAQPVAEHDIGVTTLADGRFVLSWVSPDPEDERSTQDDVLYQIFDGATQARLAWETGQPLYVPVRFSLFDPAEPLDVVVIDGIRDFGFTANIGRSDLTFTYSTGNYIDEPWVIVRSDDQASADFLDALIANPAGTQIQILGPGAGDQFNFSVYAVTSGGQSRARDFSGVVGNDAPVIGAVPPTLAYSEGDGTVALAPAATVVDANTLAGGSLRVRITGARTGDELTLADAGTLDVDNGTVRFSGTPFGTFDTTGRELLVAFNENASAAAVQALMRAVFFTTSSNDPGTAARTVTFELNDGDVAIDGANPLGLATVTINVASENDAPVLNVPGGPLSATEDTPLAITGITVSDPDVNSRGIPIRLTLSVGSGILDIRTDLAFGLTQSQVSGDTTGTIVITAPVDQINTTLLDPDGLIYRGDLDFDGADSLSVFAEDLGNIGTPLVFLTDNESVNIFVADAASNRVSISTAVTLQTDVDGDGVVDPGDTVTLEISVHNNDAALNAFFPLSGGVVALTGLKFTDLQTSKSISSNLAPGATDVHTFSGVTVDAQVDGLLVSPSIEVTVFPTSFPGAFDRAVVTLDRLTLGDRIFVDADANGLYGAGEGVATVALTLFADDGDNVFDGDDLQLATTVSGNDGAYSFLGLAPGSYIVRVDELNFASFGPLANRRSIPGAADADVDTDDGDSNGLDVIEEGAVSRAITLAYNQEPTAGPGNDTNDTLDFGFLANVAPVLDLDASGAGTGFTTAYVENGLPVSIVDTDVSISDADHTVLAGATIRITTPNPGDFLNIDDTSLQGGIVLTSFSGLAITLSGTASLADYQHALGLIRYSTDSELPGTAERSVSVVLTDGRTSSNEAFATIAVTSVNDAPFLQLGTGRVWIDYGGCGCFGATIDIGTAVTFDASGNIVAAGYGGTIAEPDLLLARLDRNGQLDPTFSGDGKVATDILGGSIDEIFALGMQGDKLLVAGHTDAVDPVSDFLVVRYNANGTIDNTFGAGGIATVGFDPDPGSDDVAFGMTVLGDGSFVLGGVASGLTDDDFAIAKYTANGTLDIAFDGDGRVVTDFLGDDDEITAIAVSGTKILAAGIAEGGGDDDFALARYDAVTGALDNTFSGDGKLILDFGGDDEAHAIAFQADGTIVLAGTTDIGPNGDFDFAVARIDPVTAATLTFTQLDFGDQLDEEIFAVAVDAANRIVVAGYAVTPLFGDSDVALARFNANGSLDTTFGTNGLVVTDFGGEDEAAGIRIDTDGTIVIVGDSFGFSLPDVILARYSASGVLDPLFGAPRYVEGGATVLLDPDLIAFDGELDTLGTYDGTTVTIQRSGGASPDDVFWATGDLELSLGVMTLSGDDIGTYTQSGGTLVLSFDENSLGGLFGIGDLQLVLSSIAYQNLNETPPAQVVIAWTIDDGNTADAQGTGANPGITLGTTTVLLTSVNDAPAISVQGALDAAVAHVDSDDVGILLGDGLGGFGVPTLLPAGSEPSAVAVGDLNGDGILDLVATNSTFGFEEVSVYIGDGLGSFSHTLVDLGPSDTAAGVALGHLDGDGDLDIVTVNFFGEVSVLRSDGIGGYDASVVAGGGFGSSAVALGDLDGDGKLDIVTANGATDDVSVFLADGSPEGFGDSTEFDVGFTPTDVALGDFNSDGRLDIVTPNNDSDDLSLLLGDGLGGFDDEIILDIGSGGSEPASVAVGDVNGDGTADIVTANYASDNVSVLLGDGAGGFLIDTFDVTGAVGPSRAALGDVDGDGDLDIVVSTLDSNHVTVLLGDGTGDFTTGTPVPTGGTGALSVALGNFDNLQLVNEDASLAFSSANDNLITVADLDANGGDETVTLSVLHGTVTLATISGLAFGSGDGTSDASMSFAGTIVELNAALAGLTYSPTSNYNGDDTLTVTINDGGNTGGGALSSTELVPIFVTALDDPAVAQPDALSTQENAVLAANVFDDNGNGADVDVDTTRTVSAVNGNTLNVGVPVALTSGALVTLASNGTLSYDPNGQFNALGGPAAGGSNTATDVFSYTLAGVSTVNVTVTIVGVDSDDILNGTPGDDVLDSGVGNDQINGLAGDDNLEGRSGNDTISGGADEDALSGGDDDDTLFGGDGDDTLYGDPGDDMLDGQDGDDTLVGGQGDDNLEGRLGSDTLFGRSGNNVMSGGDGDDTLWGGVGTDTLYGDDGNDRLDGQDGDDILVGGQGDDNLEGRAGNDTLYGRSGNNVLSGGDGDDTLWGGAGNDTLYGDDGNDTLDAQDGDDILWGGQGDDTLDGDDGADSMAGGSGSDILRGGRGADLLRGGTGSDRFDFDDANEGGDTILDFERGIDVLDLRDVLVGYGLGSNAADFVRFSGGADLVVSVNVDGADNDFVALATLQNVAVSTNLLSELILEGTLVL